MKLTTMQNSGGINTQSCYICRTCWPAATAINSLLYTSWNWKEEYSSCDH